MAAKKTSAKQNTKSTEINGSEKEVMDLRKELQSLRLEHAQFKLKNTRSIFLTRKKLAKALTMMNMTRKEAKSV